MFLNRQFINLHASLLIWLVTSDIAADYLEGATQLANLANYIMLFIFNQDVFVSGVRNMRVDIEFVITNVCFRN